MDTRREPKRQRFNKTMLAKLPPPNKGRRYIYDTESPLAVCVTDKGAISFYVYRKVAGRPVRVRLGAIDELSLENARKQAKAVAGDVAKGIDPNANKRARRGEANLGDLFDRWLDEHAKVHKKTWAEDERIFTKFVKGWRGRQLSSIRKQDVQRLHSKVGKKSGPYQANRLLALLRTVFNASDLVGWKGDNPCRAVKRFREHERDRFMLPEELPKFFKALADEPNRMLADFFELALYVGARRGNVASMRWEDVDLRNAVWRIPDTKAGDALRVPLVPEAVAVLERRRGAANGSPWVFPTRSKTGHLVEPKAAWKRICDAAGLNDLRIHDLRRTLGSWQASTGASLPVIGKALGHKQQRTTQIYARLDLDPVRASVGKAVTAITLAANGKGT